MRAQRLNYLPPCLFWLFVLPLQVHLQSLTCADHTQHPSNCINIRNCPSILKILTEEGDSRRDYLGSLTCGNDNNDPMVCCPQQQVNESYPSIPVPRSQDSLCPEINNLHRKCVDINQCPPLRNLEQQYGKSASNYLQSRSCGFNGSVARVCCPTPLVTSPLSPPSQLSLYNQRFHPRCYQMEEQLTKQVDSVGDGTNNGPAASQQSLSTRSVLVNLSVPWMAFLGYRSPAGVTQWKCEGTLISSRHVLTSADCALDPNLYLVHLGSSNLSRLVNEDDVNVRTIERVMIHPGFKRRNYENNIAVLKLGQEITPSEFIQPACLPIRNELYSKDFTTELVEIVGWDMSSQPGFLPRELQSVLVFALNLTYCNTVYSRRNVSIDQRYICGEWNKFGPNTCNNDNGGPVQFSMQSTVYLIGIMIYDCTTSWYPEVFVRVSEYLDFILQQMD